MAVVWYTNPTESAAAIKRLIKVTESGRLFMDSSILHDAVKSVSVTFRTCPVILLKRRVQTMLKKNIAFRFCFATAVFAATTMVSAQQSAPSAARGMNMNEEQVNVANIQ